MASDQSTLFTRELGPLCQGCRFFTPCGAARSEVACLEHWGTDVEGGQEILLPGFETTNQMIESVGGAQFDVLASPTSFIPLPSFLPLIRPITALSGRLKEPIYGVSAETVIGARKTPLAADQIRDKLQLSESQQLVLLLFGKDKYIERVWNEAADLFPHLAKSGYDLVIPPSFSNYLDRPRPEFLYAAKRALVIFQALQELGLSVIPRIAWNIEYDAFRFADWANQQQAVQTVALDWTGSKQKDLWDRETECLSTFDLATGRRLRYLINGPSTLSRLQTLFQIVDPKRLTLTGSVLAKPPDKQQSALTSGLPKKAAIFFSECKKRRALIARASQSVPASLTAPESTEQAEAA